MAHIRINYDGLNQQASAMKAAIQTYEGLNGRMTNLTEQISSSWVGESSRAYVEMMGKYSRQAKEMSQIMQEFLKYTTTALTDFSEVDRRCASRIRNAF